MILITGAAGFIGANLVHELNKMGREDLIIVDRLGNDHKWKNLLGVNYLEYINADDIFDEQYEELLSEVDLIYHLGACSSTTETDVDYLFENNVWYSKQMFFLATQLQIPFIYASSAATYGDGAQGYDDTHSSVDYLRPLNPYGYSKQVFDQWILKQKKTPPSWFGLKFFNVYGPLEDHKGDMRSIAHKAFGQILNSGKVKLFKSHRDDFEDGLQLRDFIYVKDCVQAMIQLALINDGAAILNLGTGEARSFKALVEQCFRSLDHDINIEYIDMPESIRDQYQYYTCANMAKFKEYLPNFKFSTLEEGVDEYIKFLKSRN